MKIRIIALLIVLSAICIGWKATQSDKTKNIVVLVKYKTQVSKENDAVAALNDLIEKVREEPNFVNIKLHVDTKDPTNVLLYEEWSDESYYNAAHMQTAHLKKFIQDSRNFLAGPPEISFWKVQKDYK